MKTANTGKKMSLRVKIIILVVILVLASAGTAVAIFLSGVKPPTGLSGEKVTPSPGITPTESAGSLPDTDADQREGVYTFLVGGTDKDNTRTDVIMLVVFDTNKKTLNILSIPRDTMLDVTRSIKKANSAYSYGSNLDDRINRFRTEIGELIGIHVNRYIIVNFRSFEKIIDAVGGVYYDVPFNMSYSDSSQDLYISLRKGPQTLNGENALKFVRFRATYAMGDIKRVQMQQDFLKVLAKQMLDKKVTPALIAEVADLILGTTKTSSGKTVKNTLTDMTIGEITWLANQARGLSSDNITFDLLPGTNGSANHLSYWIADKEKLLALINEKYNPYNSPITSIKAGSKN